MRCRSCNVLNMHALGKRVTQISMIARAVAGVNEVNCLRMLGCGMWGQLLIGPTLHKLLTDEAICMIWFRSHIMTAAKCM